MQNTLKRLTPEGISLVTDDFLAKKESYVPDEIKYCIGIGRNISLSNLDKIISDATNKYEPFNDKVDAYLAPLIHKELQLTKREAADRDIWSYLTCVKYPHFVFHRWQPHKGIVSRNRFIDRRRNTFGRLWVTADIVHEGNDYSLVEEFFSHKEAQDKINAFFDRKIGWTKHAAKVLINTLKDQDRHSYGIVLKRAQQVLTTTLYESLDEKQFEELILEIISKQ
jgi:hypothetical protein